MRSVGYVSKKVLVCEYPDIGHVCIALRSRNSFLNDVRRVAARGYEPTDTDVVRARLRTMGVQEYRFVFERGA